MPGTIVLSPHPDDETLGAAGFLLREKSLGRPTYWLNLTDARREYGYDDERIMSRTAEMAEVAQEFGFHDVFNLALEPMALDALPRRHIVEKISEIFSLVQPECVLLPHPDDAHSDHSVCFEAGHACTKSFRQPSIRRVMTMEIVSETHFGSTGGFLPNVFADISEFLDDKIRIMSLYKSELGVHPHPRSMDSIKSLATLRGSQAGVEFAEAFGLVRMTE